MNLSKASFKHSFIKRKRLVLSVIHDIRQLISNLGFDFVDLVSGKNILLLNCWCLYRRGRIVPRNLGDDINCYLFAELTGRKVKIYRNSLFGWLSSNNYVCIGSIIHLADNRSVIWGAGCLSEDASIPRIKKVCAVRGPLTRRLLLDKGYECPAVFGDPALLISRVYYPRVEKKYKYGIVFNAIDEGLVNDLVLPADTTVISFVHYSDWRTVVNQLNECECILSTSLHGLIFADSYAIPNVWVCHGGIRNIGGSFKFNDYFAAVNRHQSEPLELLPIINGSFRISSEYFEKPQICIDALLDSCPFKINIL